MLQDRALSKRTLNLASTKATGNFSLDRHRNVNERTSSCGKMPSDSTARVRTAGKNEWSSEMAFSRSKIKG